MPTDQERWAAADREIRLEDAAGRVKPAREYMPTPGPKVATNCRMCGKAFEAESSVFQTDVERLLHVTICDDCAAASHVSKGIIATVSRDERRRATWNAMVGPRYATFRRQDLPEVILPHVDRVLAWRPETTPGVGIGFLGDPRTGKSPVIFALGQKLYVEGGNVYPTSGIEFQRMYMRGIDERPVWSAYLDVCESIDVLLIDDADKLNLSAGVESEYYGMLETRRNFQRPVLCTLNLDGGQIATLGRERHDRASAIAERLRDLCDIITV